MRAALVFVLLLSLGASTPTQAQEKRGAAAPPPAAPSTPATTPKLQALIFGGGATAADAEGWMKKWQAAAPAFEGLFTPASGFPRVVESATVPGLKPGFHVVVLGFCEKARMAVPHAVVKGLFPSAYTRDVTGVTAACPELPPGATVSVTHTVRDGAQRMSALQVDTPAGSDILIALIRDDVVVSQYRYSPGPADGSTWRCSYSGLKPATSSVSLDESCEDTEALSCSGNLAAYVNRTTYVIHQDRLAATEKRVKTTHMPHCD